MKYVYRTIYEFHLFRGIITVLTAARSADAIKRITGRTCAPEWAGGRAVAGPLAVVCDLRDERHRRVGPTRSDDLASPSPSPRRPCARRVS